MEKCRNCNNDITVHDSIVNGELCDKCYDKINHLEI